jgi:hypothetical protein
VVAAVTTHGREDAADLGFASRREESNPQPPDP